MSDIHHAAATGFGAAAAEYERGRPAYPQPAIDHLVQRLDLRPGATVLDLAAGTGKLTRQLVPTGATLIALEPVAAMREQLVASIPGIEAIDCTAEQISWPDADADAIVVAQAFHWFDAPAAMTEIHRVLRDGGGLGILFNTRDTRVDWVARLNSIIDPFEGDAPRHKAGAWRDAFTDTTLFTPLEVVEFANPQPLDASGLVDRVASISFIASLADNVRAGVLDQVRALAAELPASFELPHRTYVYTCSKR